MCSHPAASNKNEINSLNQPSESRSGTQTPPLTANSQKHATTNPHPQQSPPLNFGAPKAMNVSFANDSTDSTAYREHNPPAVLRKQEAARREGTPTTADQSQQVSPVNTDAEFSPPTRPYTPPDSVSSIRNLKLEKIKSKERQGVYGPYKPGTASVNTSGFNLSTVETQILKKQDEVHILVAVTGSVATIKLPLIIHKLKQIYRNRAVIQVVVTKSSTHFFDPKDLPQGVKVWYDNDEWRSRIKHGVNDATAHVEQQLHIQLRRWADILLVAPCSANTLAKLTYGICDNLLTSIFRVWNPEVPILIAPAMNTHMYTNPVTKRHFNVLKQFFPFVDILKPVEKVLVCGDIGMGGMREWTDIVQLLVKRIGVPLEDESEDSDSDSN